MSQRRERDRSFRAVMFGDARLPRRGGRYLLIVIRNSGSNMRDQCPICAEEMSLQNDSPLMLMGRNRNSSCRLECCRHEICQSCLFRHVQSILEEGVTGQGRSYIKCPFGCGQELNDSTVREIIAAQYPQYLVCHLIGFLATTVNALFLTFLVPNTLDEDIIVSCRNIRLYWSLSWEAQRVIGRYERWSLTVGLRDLPSVHHCPMPDCGYVWVSDATYRRQKQVHERKPYYLWYSPPAPEQIPYDWVEPEYVTMGGNYIADATADCKDGRRMVCAKCHAVFCGLCRRPWWVNRRQNHEGITCRRYQRMLPDPEYTMVGQVANCRSCPGCTLRVHRTDGCNHMTCPCGTEWCYVCECRWSMRHYACVDDNRGRGGTTRQQQGDCVIL